MINLLLCGGSGTRLWPLSRQLMPKQFVHLMKGHSLFQRTVARNHFCGRTVIISNSEQYFLALEQLEEMSDTVQLEQFRFLLEPVGRNTAPAIALACMGLQPEELLLVTPSDHLIADQEEYRRAVERAKELALQGNLVTFGITPTRPETGYGYIQANGEQVVRFVEKPDLERAQSYLKSGDYFWNSGMFCFTAGKFLEELEKYAPEILNACQKALESARRQENFLRIKRKAMEQIPANSIDYAVMEKSDKVKVVSTECGWSDLGDFESLYNALPKDRAGNTQQDNFISLDSQNNLILTRDRLVATIDLEDHLVVDTSDALLIAPRTSSQKVKQIVEQLNQQGSQLTTVHITAARPWGTYTVLREGQRYKIKQIVVKPGARLSLQKHLHRSEHWIVLTGKALVTIGEREIEVHPNESTYIPAGTLHRLENRGTTELKIVEVQVGDYVGEDDIERFDDDYQRDDSF